MNKKVIFTVCGLIIFCIAIFFIYGVFSNDSKTLEMTYTVEDKDEYKWEYEINDEKTIKVVDTYVVSENGKTVSTNYVFKGLKKGFATVKFKYIRISDNKIVKTEVTTLRVDSLKNISLTVYDD